MTPSDKAKRFAELHVKGEPLVLYNAWDAGSAEAIVKGGAEAIATSSWAVARALGYDDCEKTPRAFVEEVVGGIVEKVQVQVTADFEGSYSEDDDELAKNVGRLLHLGAVGINIEDRIVSRSGIYSANRQARRIRAIRETASQKNVDLFINARTDLFLGRKDPARFVDAAIERAKIYADAGASGFFIPGLTKEELIGKICDGVSLPVNVMYVEGLPANDRLARLGVARVSYGKVPYERAMEAVQRDAERILTHRVVTARHGEVLGNSLGSHAG